MNGHLCTEDKEEDGIDSCVDCWPPPEDKTQCKSKKKKKKGKGLCSEQVRGQSTEFNCCMHSIQRCIPIRVCVFLQRQKDEGHLSEGNKVGHNLPSSHTCRTKETFSSSCGDTFANVVLRLPWTIHQKNLSLNAGSLVELLVCEKRNNQKYTFLKLVFKV